MALLLVSNGLCIELLLDGSRVQRLGDHIDGTVGHVGPVGAGVTHEQPADHICTPDDH